jgi:hypothetical protein
VAGRIRSTEKSRDLIGIRTRDLPACSIVPLRGQVRQEIRGTVVADALWEETENGAL